MRTKKPIRYCNWCGKHRTKFSGVEKRCILSGRWSEMCTYCDRQTDRVMTRIPLAGLLPVQTRPVGQSSQT